MFGTNEKFNLIRATYTKTQAPFTFFEDFYKPGTLRFGSNAAGESADFTDFLFDIDLTIDGVTQPYSYFADEGSILVGEEDYSAEFAIADENHVRVRGFNSGLRLSLRSSKDDSASGCKGQYNLPDGSGWEGHFGKNGKVFIRILSGSFYASADYDDETNRYKALVLDFIPDQTTGIFEAAIYQYLGEALSPCSEFAEFDEIVAANKLSFEEFSQIYPPAPRGYEELSKYARWLIWSHRTGVTQGLSEPLILFQNGLVVTCASWQQSYNAMAMRNDPEEAWRMICAMFKFQDEATGRIPGMLTYQGGNAGQQPPFQGFALEYLLREIGDDFLTFSRCKTMYPKFVKWAEFWLTYRNAGRGDDVTVMYSPHDSGWDDASNFQDGLPAQDPNNMAFMVLLMECIARLAIGCGKAEESSRWSERAEKLLNTIINEFWDGEKFVTKVRGKNVKSLSLSCYQPLILGKRLPQDIIDKCAERLMEEGQWLTEIGLASESMQSEYVTFGRSFVCGRVVGPQNMILTVALKAAGKDKEAKIIAKRFCDHASREGIILGYAPYDYFPRTGEMAPQQEVPTMMDGWPWSSWTANCILTMLGAVID